MNIKDKIKYSIATIQKAEAMALTFREYGFHLAFSGGKDSIVIHELCRMAGVKFRAFMSVTTLDPPELMKFIRTNYPALIMERPKINFFKLIEKKGMLPTRLTRYCYQVFKEQSGAGSVVITGIRKTESRARNTRNELELLNHRYSNTLDQFNMDLESHVVCIKGKDKVIFNPIIYWTDQDVWDFIAYRNLPYCSLYDEGYKRIGCIFCPMSSKKTKAKDRLRYPKVEKAIKKSIQYLVDNKNFGKNFNYNTDLIFDW